MWKTNVLWRFTILLYVVNDTDDTMRVQNTRCGRLHARSFVHTREKLWKRRNKKKEMGEWENRGEKGGGVKSKRNEIEQRKEGRKRKMENNRGAWRREDRQTRWYHYKRADNRISTQFVWDSLPCRMGNPQKTLVSLLFRPSSFCHRNTFSGILSITPKRTANIIRTAASLTDRKIFLRSRILWCLFGIWVVCETLFSSPLKNRDLHIRPLDTSCRSCDLFLPTVTGLEDI